MELLCKQFLLLFCFFICTVCSNESKQVLVALKQNNMAELQHYVTTELSNPLSKNYGNYLSVEELANVVGASETAVSYTISYLHSIGGQKITVSPTRDYIEFSINHRISNELQEQVPKELQEYVEFFAVLSPHNGSESSFETSEHHEFEFLDVHFTNHKMPFVFSNFGESTKHVNIWIIPTSQDVSDITITFNQMMEMNPPTIGKKYSQTFRVGEIQCTPCEELSFLPFHSMFQRNQFCSLFGRQKEVCLIDNLHVLDHFPFLKDSLLENNQQIWKLSATFQTLDGRNSLEGFDDLSFTLLGKEWDPNSQKQVYKQSISAVASSAATQIVWGTGSYGYSSSFVSFLF